MSLRIQKKILRPDEKLIKSFQSIPSCIASDALNRMQAMQASIKPLSAGMKAVGPAITVRVVPGDNSALHHAIYLAQRGDILVIDGRGNEEIAIFGSIQTEASQRQGIGGIVVDGVVRDISQIRASGLPVFARGACPAGPHRGWGGDINVPISCGGVPVHPGDIIISDDDGVVVIPYESAALTLENSLKQMGKEQQWLKALSQGVRTLDFLDLNIQPEEIE